MYHLNGTLVGDVMGISEKPLRVVFMGTPAYAVPVLNSIVESGHEIVGVFTRPDTRAGRGKQVVFSPVKHRAMQLGIKVFQPNNLKGECVKQAFSSDLVPDIAIVAAYGLFLPESLLNVPPLKTLNIHPSLLPKYRGASPVASAILNGDKEAGVSIMLIDDGVDTGPIIGQKVTEIRSEETGQDLTQRLFELGAYLLRENLPKWRQGSILPTPQDSEKASMTSRLTREQGEIEWRNSADYISRQVRAFYPWPGTHTYWDEVQLKITEASVLRASFHFEPGKVIRLHNCVAVTTGSELLKLEKIQLSGRNVTGINDFVAGYNHFIGASLGSIPK